MIYLEMVFHLLEIVQISDVRMRENKACITEVRNMAWSINIFKLIFSDLFQMNRVSPLFLMTTQKTGKMI